MSTEALVALSASGVVGVGLTAGALLWHVRQILPQRPDPGLSVAWLLVAAGALVGAPPGAEGADGIGGAMIVAGLLVLGRPQAELGPGERRSSIGMLLVIVIPLAIAAVLLPSTLWTGVYGLALLIASVRVVPRGRDLESRQLLNLGVALIAIAAIGLMLMAIRPTLAPVVTGAVAVLLFGGTVGLAAATVLGPVATETAALGTRLRDLEDDHEHLLRLTESDPLTGCPTRRALRAWFERWQGGQPVSVALIDVDNLKRINERHGHEAGDEALRLMAGVLSSSIRPGDLVVRWGGDEFVVVLRGAEHEAATRRLTSLMASLEASTAEFPYDEPLRFDWGVSTCTSPGDISRALAEADERMFAMKRRR